MFISKLINMWPHIKYCLQKRDLSRNDHNIMTIFTGGAVHIV